jgi:MFS family permease
VLGLGRVIVILTQLFGASLLVFSHFPFFWPAMGLLALTGFGMIMLLASANTVLQTIVEDSKRGRLMSFYAMSFGGMVPFGSLVAGFLASSIGARNTVLIGGLVCIAGGMWFARELPRLRGLVRPIYVQKGILREVAVGLQSATEQAGQPKINGPE